MNFFTIKIKHTVWNRAFAASVYCLFAFFARYTVHYGHECDEINPWQKSEKHSEVKTAISKSNCHSTSTHNGDHLKDKTEEHKHSDCQICHSYEELVQSIFEEFTPSIAIQIENIEIIAEDKTAIPYIKTTSYYSPRGPPRA